MPKLKRLRWQLSFKKQYEARVDPQLWEQHVIAIINSYKTHTLEKTRAWITEELHFSVS